MGINVEGNTSTPATARQPATNLNLGAKTLQEDIAMDLSDSEDGEQLNDDKLEGNANAFNNAREIQTVPI